MTSLIKQMINELKLQIFNEEENTDNDIVVVYSGKFQPMALQHKTAYDWVVKQFGKENTYVATTDISDTQFSPLNFDQKRKIIKRHGITNVVKVNQLYNVNEIVNTLKLNPKKTVLIYLVGEGDKSELKGIKRLMTYNKTTAIPIKDLQNPYVYYLTVPKMKLQIPDFGEMNSENIRKALGDREAKLAQLKSRFESIMGWFDAGIFNMVISKFNSNRGKLREDLSEWMRVLTNMSQQQGEMFFGILKKEYGDTKDLLPIIRKFMRGKELNADEKKTFQRQMKDTMKLLGLGAIAAIPIPGTMLLIPVIINLAKKFNINLLPETVEEDAESLPIVKREFWDEVFQEVSNEETIDEKKEQLDEVVQIPDSLERELEEYAIKLFKHYASLINDNLTSKDIEPVFRDFREDTLTVEIYTKMGNAINKWLKSQEFALDFRVSEKKVWPLYLKGPNETGFHIKPVGSIKSGYEQLINLVKFCLKNSGDCQTLRSEIEYLLDDKVVSEFEKQGISSGGLQYDKLYAELSALGAESSFLGGGEFGSIPSIIWTASRNTALYDGYIAVKLQIYSFSIAILVVKYHLGTSKSLDSFIESFVKKSVMPFLLHEVVHAYQSAKEIAMSNKKRTKAYQSVSRDDDREKWKKLYLSDKTEIAAYAVEFAKELKANFPEMSNVELLNMIQNRKVPKGTSSAHDMYYTGFFKEMSDYKTNEVKKRFLKLVYQELSR